MKITFSSVLMAVLWSGFLLGIIYMMRKKCLFIKSFGIGCVVMVYLFCMLRMLLPIDFSFTKGISVKGVFSDFYDAVFYKEYSAGSFQITIADGLLIVWSVVTVGLLCHFVYEYRNMNRWLEHLTVREDGQCKKVLQEVFSQKKKTRKVTVLCSREVQMPIGIGIWNRRILLPDREYSDRELYYILLHEYTHFLNGDLVIKILVHIFCGIFWWNPMVYFFRKNLDQSLEIKCDLCVTESLSTDEAASYLQVIVATLKASRERNPFSALHNAASFGNGEKHEMVERFQIILKNKKNEGWNSKYAAIGMTVLFSAIWLLSYAFVPLPTFEPPIEDIVEEPGDYNIMPQNTYVKYKDGIYYLIIDGKTFCEITEEDVKRLKQGGHEIRRE